jgi:hypothetical protein
VKQANGLTLTGEHRNGAFTMDMAFFLVAALIVLLALEHGEAAARGASAHFRRLG